MFTRSLKIRLILSVLAVLVVTQTITAVWLWHEAQEQIAIWTAIDLSDADMAVSIAREKRESLLAFALPVLASVLVSAVLMYGLIHTLIQPLEHLVAEVNTRSTHDLSQLTLDDRATLEVASIVDSTNRLLQRVATGLEHERDFTADVAHELRTPLAGIRMHLELIAEERPESVAPLIARIDDLMALTDQLLQLARASQQHRAGHLTMQPIDLVADVCQPLALEYEWYDDVQLVWHLPPIAPVLASAPLLYIALKNLLANARKYAGDHPEITVDLQADEEVYQLQVSDNGDGVHPALLGQLTDSFFRADHAKPGYGLGLSIVKRIADWHHASLQLDNGGNGGLQILLRLPKHIR